MVEREDEADTSGDETLGEGVTRRDDGAERGDVLYPKIEEDTNSSKYHLELLSPLGFYQRLTIRLSRRGGVIT